MKTKLILSIIILGISVLSAQTVSKPTKIRKYIKPYNDTLWRKNEIGFGISAPGLSDVFVRRQKDIFDCNLQYKRLFTKNNVFRLGLNYYSESENYSSSSLNRTYPSIVDKSDTITIVNTEYIINKTSYLNFGFEHFFGKKRVKFILGSDITIGYSNNDRQVLYNKYVTKIDTLLNGNFIYSYSEINESSNINGFYSPSGISYIVRSNNLLIGIKPFIGLRANLSNRLAFNFYTSFHFIYTDNFKSDFSERTSSLNFEMNGLVSEVSLFYRF